MIKFFNSFQRADNGSAQVSSSKKTLALELERVTTVFNRGTVNERRGLDDLSLTLAPGEFGVIVGGNGSGKSTLMNTIAGQLRPDRGEILLDGTDVTRLPENQRARLISRVFQDPVLGSAPRMTIRQNLAIAARRGRSRGLGFSLKKQEQELFEERMAELGLGLEDRLDTAMEHLSGGQRQAVSLVMATLRPSKLLLLDEHTAALDPHTQRVVMELTEQIVRRYGLTTLMITHSLEDAEEFGDSLAILDAGRIVRTFSGDAKQALSAEDIFAEMTSCRHE